MKPEELRTLDAEELDGKLKDARRELYELRFKLAVGQLDNHRQIRQVRKDIARILTIVHQRRWEGWEDETEEPVAEAGVGARRASPASGEAEVAEADTAEPAIAEPDDVGARRASPASGEAEAAEADVTPTAEAAEGVEAPQAEAPVKSRRKGRARKAEAEDSDD
jgi:large subunit ribosomal protein L29